MSSTLGVRVGFFLSILLLASSHSVFAAAQDRSALVPSPTGECDPLCAADAPAEDRYAVTVSGIVLSPNGKPAKGAVVVSSSGGMATTNESGAYTLELQVPNTASAVQVTAVGGGGQSNLTATQRIGGLAPGLAVQTGPLSMQVTTGCQTAWLPTFGSMPGTDGDVQALITFDDGNGPALYLGGSFLNAGDVSANYIARWNGSSWSTLGSGMDNAVQAFAVFDDGTGPALYAGGLFTTAGGVPVNGIAKWDGSSWSALGVGMNGGLSALAVFDDGAGPALYAGGLFTYAGGLQARNVAKWDGTQWIALASGVNNRVQAVCVHDDGSGPALYAGGWFTTADGNPATRIARWDGAAWSSVGSGFNSTVYCLASFNDRSGSKLYAGGSFDQSGSSPPSHCASWDGAAWTAVGNGTAGFVRALASYDDGSGSGLYAGAFYIGPGQVMIVAGSGGTGIGGLDGATLALAGFDSGGGPALYAAGAFTNAAGLAAKHVVKQSAGGTAALGNGGLSEGVSALVVFDDGSGSALYAGGHGLARWDGSSWTVSAGFGFSNNVFSLAVYDNGSGPALYGGGDVGVCRWNGSGWTGLFTGGNGQVRAMAVYDDGGGPALYFGGDFNYSYAHIAKLLGSTTSSVGQGTNGFVSALAVYDDGAGPALYVAGNFQVAGSSSGYSCIARWDGTSWLPLGTGTDGTISCLTVADLGFGPALYAGGAFDFAGGVSANRVAKWNGSAWYPLGAGIGSAGWSVYSLCGLDDGGGPSLFAAGHFTSAGSLGVNHIARWDGAAWSAVGSGLSGEAHALAVFDNGDCRGPTLVVGGSFTTAYDSHDSFVARWGCASPGFTPGCYGGICFGDSTVACPCGNNGLPGRGCSNSGGQGAVLNGTGVASIANDTLLLTSSAELPSVLSIFLQGTTQVAPTQFGDGLRCVGGNLKRLYSKNAIAGVATAPGVGDLTVSAKSASLSDPLAAGSVRYMQTYYRDSVLSFCTSPQGSSFNVSSGVVVTWAP